MMQAIFDEAAALVCVGLFTASTWLWLATFAGG